MREPILLQGHELVPSVGIGIVLSKPGVDTTETLLRDADLAMYRAKTAGKSRYEIFDQSMGALAIDRLQLEGDLRHAIARRELRVVYQPIMTLESGRIREVERSCAGSTPSAASSRRRSSSRSRRPPA